MSAANLSCSFKINTSQLTQTLARGPQTPGSFVFYTASTQGRFHYVFAVAVGT